MTSKNYEFAATCVRENRVHDFYISRAWRNKRAQILAADRYECQICKQNGKYSRAEVVHHVKHLRHRPDLALCDTYTDDCGQQHRQLVSVCKDCHETVCHPERLQQNRPQHPKGCDRDERWD